MSNYIDSHRQMQGHLEGQIDEHMDAQEADQMVDESVRKPQDVVYRQALSDEYDAEDPTIEANDNSNGFAQNQVYPDYQIDE